MYLIVAITFTLISIRNASVTNWETVDFSSPSGQLIAFGLTCLAAFFGWASVLLGEGKQR